MTGHYEHRLAIAGNKRRDEISSVLDELRNLSSSNVPELSTQLQMHYY